MSTADSVLTVECIVQAKAKFDFTWRTQGNSKVFHIYKIKPSSKNLIWGDEKNEISDL